MTIAAGQDLAHYRLLGKIGEGGMGEVWRARDTRLGREIAVKFLPEPFSEDPEKRARFEREAKAVAALNHPNIITIFSVETAEGLHFFTMELVDGRPLSALFRPGGLGLDELLAVAVPLADAIAAAHDCGIVHRDLKPGNVMVSGAAGVKILDFGLARVREAVALPGPVGAEQSTISIEHSFSGTVAYASPEQLRGEPADHRSDIFSLGLLLYELATGVAPFEGETTADRIASVLKDSPPRIHDLNPSVPAGLDRIVRRCLDRNVRERFASAAEVRRDLEQLRQDPGLDGADAAPSIAILPFLDLSPERDQAYFCEGAAEEILNALSRVGGLRVASRSSAFQFRDAGCDVREIGRRLGVRSVLEGSVRKAGGRLRVTVQLIDARNDRTLWSDRYDRGMEDVFAIQEEIANSVVGALRLTLTATERGALARIPTRNVQAYDYWLRGRKFYDLYGRRDVEFALQLFSRAVELDPGFAAAHAGLADCWSYVYLYGERSEAALREAEAESRRAIELDPDSAPAYTSRGVALSLSGRDSLASKAFATAVSLDPRFFEAWYFWGRHCFASGRSDEALRLWDEASQVRPEDFQALLLSAQIHDGRGERAEAARVRRRGVAVAEERLNLSPDDARALYMAANGLVGLGEIGRGMEFAARARALRPDEPMLQYNLACIYALASRTDEALGCLERAHANGLTQKGWYVHDTDLTPLHGHPRFEALLKKMA